GLNVVTAPRRISEPFDERLVVTPRRLEEPPAHRVERRRQWVERLLYRREAAHRPVESEDIAWSSRRLDERAHQPDALAPHLEQAIPQESKVIRARGRLQRVERFRHVIGMGAERLGELLSDRRVQMTLNPTDPLECSEER